MPFVIGVAGGTGSGKTTVAEKVSETLAGEETALIIEQDSYYKDLSHLPLSERVRHNFDHPDAIDFDLLTLQINELLAGQAIAKPMYDFVNHCRLPETVAVGPAEVILVEGILVFHHEPLLNLMDLKIFVDTDADIRIIRRIKRDIEERGRSFESVRSQYFETVRPMHIKYVEPSKHWADIVIPEGGKNAVAIDTIVARIRQWLRDARS
jgi:uridine kinase